MYILNGREQTFEKLNCIVLPSAITVGKQMLNSNWFVKILHVMYDRAAYRHQRHRQGFRTSDPEIGISWGIEYQIGVRTILKISGESQGQFLFDIVSYVVYRCIKLNPTDQISSLPNRKYRLGGIRKLFVIGQLYLLFQDLN